MLIERHRFVDAERSAVEANGAGILLDKVAIPVADGDFEGPAVDLGRQNGGPYCDAILVAPLADGNGTVAYRSRHGPGGIFRSGVAAPEGDPQNIIAKSCDSFVEISLPDFDGTVSNRSRRMHGRMNAGSKSRLCGC